MAMAGGQPVLNTKFAAGMERFAEGWGGPVDCLLPLRAESDAFSEPFDADRLAFGLRHRAPDHRIGADDLRDVDVILASGDIHEYLGLVPLAHEAGKKIVYVVELTPQSRRQIALLDPKRSRFQKLKTMIWLERQEILRKRALGMADGLQVNGYPAWDQYSSLNDNTLLYLDNRISADLLASPDDMAARKARLRDGAPLQIVHSGRLERIKGSQGLTAIARGLRDRGVRFDLHVFGTGSLEADLAREIAAEELHQVHLHGSVDFADELVPFCRAKGDLFLSLHLQSDPSCTYVESFGCGLPILGYSNRMWTRLQRDSGAGWVAPLRDIGAVVDRLVHLDGARGEICAASDKARDFAAAHLFETEFARRLDQLRQISGMA